MRPFKYTEKNDEVIFHYTFTQLRQFLTRGRTHGDVGGILTKFTNNRTMSVYRCFGTIENPTKLMSIITLMINPIFNETNDPEIIITEPKSLFYSSMSYKFVIMDLSESTSNIKIL